MSRAMRCGTAARIFHVACLAAAAVLAGPAGPTAISGQTPGLEPADASPRIVDLRNRIDTYVAPLKRAGQLSGTLLVAVDGRVVYERAFGMANYELGIANTVSTKHGIASVTKLLTAVLTLGLVDRGVLDLRDRLETFLPEFPRGDEITVEHLLRHRSGIRHRVTSEGNLAKERTAADMVELAGSRELLFEPGSDRAYSSAGYSVLARVLEVATGCRFSELLEREVLHPAGALQTDDDDGWRPVRGRSADYLYGNGGPVPADPADLSFLIGAGSVFSTPRDLYRIVRTLVAGVYGEQARSELLGENADLTWNGWTFGYRAFIDHRRTDDITVIFAGNVRTGAIDLVRRDVPSIASGEEVAPPSLPDRRPVPFPAEVRGTLSGTYQFSAGEPDSEETLRFAPDGGFATLGGWVLVPASADRLWETTGYGSLTVLHDDDGTVRGLEWEKAGDSFVLPRVGDLP